jgi:dolichyldiphosphatase
VLALGAFLSWLRVRLGYHTPEQVWAGAALGGLAALAWHAASAPALGALAEAAGSEAAAGAALRGVAAAAAVAFAAGNARAWLPPSLGGRGG